MEGQEFRHVLALIADNPSPGATQGRRQIEEGEAADLRGVERLDVAVAPIEAPESPR